MLKLSPWPEVTQAGDHRRLYPVSMVVLLTAVGVEVFRETRGWAEVAGLAGLLGQFDQVWHW